VVGTPGAMPFPSLGEAAMLRALKSPGKGFGPLRRYMGVRR
jgi:hypothetical protein